MILIIIAVSIISTSLVGYATKRYCKREQPNQTFETHYYDLEEVESNVI